MKSATVTIPAALMKELAPILEVLKEKKPGGLVRLMIKDCIAMIHAPAGDRKVPRAVAMAADALARKHMFQAVYLPEKPVSSKIPMKVWANHGRN